MKSGEQVYTRILKIIQDRRVELEFEAAQEPTADRERQLVLIALELESLEEKISNEGSRGEMPTQACLCASIIGTDETRHFKECPKRSDYPKASTEACPICCGSGRVHAIPRPRAPAPTRDPHPFKQPDGSSLGEMDFVGFPNIAGVMPRRAPDGPGDVPEVLRVSRVETEPAARITEEKREEGAPEVIRAEKIPGNDATALHWATVLAVAGMLRAQAEHETRLSDEAAEKGNQSLANILAGGTAALKRMAEKLERKVLGKT